MYSISLIDRTNLGLALVAGMQEDLGLAVGNRYTVIVMVFFVAYVYVLLMIWVMTNTNPCCLVFSKFRAYVNLRVGCCGGFMLTHLTEPHPAQGWTCQLALVSRSFIWCDFDWHGLYAKLGNHGSVPRPSWNI